MSSGCGDVLSLADLQTAKKHQIFEAEVITGKSGGVAGGSDIDYATNQVTGQTQKTLPAVLRDAGFSPVSWDFSTGGTLTVNDRDKVVYDPVSKTWYSYAGTLPVVAPASFNPVGNANWKPRTDPYLRDDLSGLDGIYNIGAANYADIRAYTGPADRINCYGRSSIFDNASGYFFADSSDTTTPDNDGTVLVDASGRRWKRSYTGPVDARWFGVTANGSTDDTDAANKALATLQHVVFPVGTIIINAPLIFGTQTIEGAGTYPNGSYGTIIQCTGDHAAFEHAPTGHQPGGIIRNFWINYQAGKPTITTGNAKGVNFGTSNTSIDPLANGATKFIVENVIVRGAYWGFYDVTSTYLMEYRNCWAWDCYVGFKKQYGTTVKYSSCYALDCYGSWDMQDSHCATFENCAYDGTSIIGNIKPIYFKGCPGVTINGMQHEASKIDVSGRGDFVIENCVGFVLNGMSIPSWLNTLTTGEAYLFEIINSTADIKGVALSADAANVKSSGANTYLFNAKSGSIVNVSASGLPAVAGSSFNYSMSTDSTSRIDRTPSAVIGGLTAGAVFRNGVSSPVYVDYNSVTIAAGAVALIGTVTLPGVQYQDFLMADSSTGVNGCTIDVVRPAGASGSVNVYIRNNNTSPVTLSGQIAIRYLRP